jgi:hypothetical protein
LNRVQVDVVADTSPLNYLVHYRQGLLDALLAQQPAAEK